MGIEAGNYIGDLVVTNPTPGDPKSFGDDHLRLLKTAARQSFPGFTGAVMVTGVDGGAVNAYTLTPAAPLVSYTNRTFVAFTPAASNTGAVTLNVSALGAKDVRTVDGGALIAGDLTAGVPVLAAYDGSQFRLTSITKRYADQLAFASSFPSQAGNAGKFSSTDGTNVLWAWAQTMPRSARTANAQLVQTDRGSLADITSGTFAQTFDAAATLGSGWYVWLRNSGTGDVTLDPNGTEQIDGLTSYIMYPGEVRLVQCDGTAFRSMVVRPFSKTYIASGNFAKPPGYTNFGGLGWSGGQSGSRQTSTGTAAPGGNAGGCFPFTLPATQLGATETVTIGAGGAPISGTTGGGNAGGNTSLGTVLTIFGGSASGGGSINGAKTNSGTTSILIAGGFEAGDNQNGVSTVWGGASAGSAAFSTGSSIYGGAPGGGINGSNVYPPGASTFGGNGGAASIASSGSDGVAPGGGGGATRTGTASGAGARGELRIWGIA